MTDVKYLIDDRCLVPQCETEENPDFDGAWVRDILPGSVSESSGAFTPHDVCKRFIYTGDTNSTNFNETCSASNFGPNDERCSQWVFEENTRTIVNDVRRALASQSNEI